MDKREALKSMLNNLINDKHEEATLDLHGYLTAKMQEVSGIGSPAPSAEIDDNNSSIDDDNAEE